MASAEAARAAIQAQFGSLGLDLFGQKVGEQTTPLD
jgi:hypothetical protein